MTPFRLSLLSAAIVCSIAPAIADQTSTVYGIRDKTPNLLAFTHATVHTEPGKKIENATVLVVDGKISAVGSSSVPAGYRQIDARGYHIYAGFIDAYSVYGVEKAAEGNGFAFGRKPVYQNDRKGGNASNGAIHAQQQWVNTFVPVADDAKAYLQQGFTAVQSAKLDGIFRGQSFVASLATGLPGELVLKANGPQFMAFGKGTSKQSYPSSLMGSIALIRQTLSDANWYRDAYGKQDQLQTHQPVEFNAALAALTNLDQSGLVFETEDDRALLRVDSLLKEFNLKNAVMLGSGYEYSRIDDIKKTGRTVIVPVAYPAAPAVANIDDQLDVSLADLRHWERAPANLAVMAKAGVPFALTTHALEKKDQFWPNLRTAMKHGLTADQALAALTTVPAQLVGLPQQLGKIAVGYQADLVISKGDLFTDGEIVATWARGQEQQFKPLQPVEFAGTYAVELAGKSLSLELTGLGDKLSGKLKQADKQSELKNVQQKQQQLQFTVDLAAAEAGSGVLQFQGVLDGNLLKGEWLLPSGQSQKVLLSKQATTAKADDKKDKAVDTQLVSMLTFPNRAFGTQQAQVRQNAHIKNATVWTSDKAGKLENTDVIIKDGKFSKIGKNLSTPSGYQVIDATGMHLTAGIIDEHSHIAIEAGVNEGTDAVTSEVRIGDVLNPEDINLYRGLAGGTTTAQLLHGSANPIGGQAQIIQLRWGVTPEQL
ncbi:MAG: amidohydrolase family protein, partial [Gammaproteobacteria bacterium]|nr:amidohydrolase family protein [Gammaproteobacteria bacterium]